MSDTRSKVVLSGTDSATMINAVDINRELISHTTSTARADRFWSSLPAYDNDPSQEVLEITYASAGITNRITFDAVRFPQTITLQYISTNGTDWAPLLDSVTGQPIQVEVMDCHPPILNSPAMIPGHLHPQHDYEGHWAHFEVECDAVEIERLRFILQRNNGTRGPLSVAGRPVAYSLALQNIDTGYRISSEDDIPLHADEPDSNTSSQVFANSADLFGSNLGFSKKTHRAANLAFNTEDTAPLIWKCEPQPSSNAVVNFYADLRDAQGHAQTINQIFIDPLYVGPSINLYYSNDAIGPNFKSKRARLSSSQAAFNGAVIRNDGVLDLGTWHSTTTVDDGSGTSTNITIPAFFDPYSVQIDNLALGFDPSIDWWVGIEWTRGWDINTDTNNHPLFDCDQFQVGSNNQNFYLITAAGDLLTVPNTTVQDVPIQIAAGYREGQLHLSVQQSGAPQTNLTMASVALSDQLPQKLIIGSDLGADAYSGGKITSFILSQAAMPIDVMSQESVDASGTVTYTNVAVKDSFLDNPSGYSLVPRLANKENLSQYSALLRFASGQSSLTNWTGFFGGAAHPYEDMNWTPISRTYEMQRGLMKVPTTKAKFWNLEMTNLRPEINDKFVPVTRTVKLFPAELYQTTTPTTRSTTGHSYDDTALTVQQSSSTGFIDQPQYRGTGDNGSGISNTDVYVANDYDIKQKLAAASDAWKFEQFHPDRTAPRFNKAGPHVYVEREVTQTSNVSFFCGLRQIRFSRTVVTAPQNFDVIEEDFIDPRNIASGNWQNHSAGIYSGPDPSASVSRATSIVMPTVSGVRGLQFASQQSDPTPLSINGNFSDPSYDPSGVGTWSRYGDGKIFGINMNSDSSQSALLVSRSSDHGYWADITVNFGPTYGEIAAATTAYRDFLGGTRNSSHEGGVQSKSISAPFGGRLHAAARVTASQALAAPLYAQIVDTDTGSVLAEAQSNVSKNQAKQWYASVDMKAFAAKTGRTWADLTGRRKVYPSFTDTFVRPASSFLGQMDSGQTWTSTGFSLTTTGTTARVGTTGARSDIDLLTPWGTMSVRLSTVTTTTTHSSAVPVLDLGSFILMNDGTFLNTNDSAIHATLSETLSTLHDYNFTFMPTASVPSGQAMPGVNVSAQPYSIVITTGTLGSDTWLQTISSARAFRTVRSLMGPVGTNYLKFGWVPGVAQVRTATILPSQVNVSPSLLVDGENNNYSYDLNGVHYMYQGQYTYAADAFGLSTSAASLRPSGSFLATPTGLASSAATSGGIFTAGTYYYVVTALNGFGETIASNEVSQAVVSGGTVSLNWTAVAGATNYNVYRGTATGNETMVGNSAGGTTFIDLGDVTDSSSVPPKYNSTNGAGTMQVADLTDQFGIFQFNVTQMPSNMTAADVILAYVDYNPAAGMIMTLRGDGKIFNEITGSQIATLPGFNPLAGRVSIYYANMAIVSSAVQTAVGASTGTAIIFYQNGNTYLGSYRNSNPTTWTSTVRGIGGANNGTSAGQYTVIEGFGWSPDGASLATNVNNVTWAQVDDSSTRTYSSMAKAVVGTSQNLAMRIVQKGETNDSWLVQDATFFWDPVVWEFSCDSGLTWWEAADIRNDPNGVLLFPFGLTSYNGLMWRLTSYAGRVVIAHLAIRPWYVGQHGYSAPNPAHLPSGPNVVPYDDYAPIERDPRWMAWDKPVPRWWWNAGISA